MGPQGQEKGNNVVQPSLARHSRAGAPVMTTRHPGKQRRQCSCASDFLDARDPYKVVPGHFLCRGYTSKPSDAGVVTLYFHISTQVTPNPPTARLVKTNKQTNKIIIIIYVTGELPRCWSSFSVCWAERLQGTCLVWGPSASMLSFGWA